MTEEINSNNNNTESNNDNTNVQSNITNNETFEVTGKKYDYKGQRLYTEKNELRKLDSKGNVIEKHSPAWYDTHTLLQETYNKFREEHNKIPTMQELSRESGISVASCHRHLSEVTIKDSTDQFKMNNTKILETLTKLAESGDTKAIKLYTEIIGEWVQTQKVETENKNINININFDSSTKEPNDIIDLDVSNLDGDSVDN